MHYINLIRLFEQRDKTMTNQKYTYAIVYTGSPYGDDEAGHVVSRHRTLKAAWAAYDRAFSGTTGVKNNSVIDTATGESITRPY